MPSKKRMMNWMQPASPMGVFDASFSSDSSNESWVVSASVSSSSSSPEPLFKRRRVQEQQMRLSSISRMFLDVFSSSPH